MTTWTSHPLIRHTRPQLRLRYSHDPQDRGPRRWQASLARNCEESRPGPGSGCAPPQGGEARQRYIQAVGKRNLWPAEAASSRALNLVFPLLIWRHSESSRASFGGFSLKRRSYRLSRLVQGQRGPGLLPPLQLAARDCLESTLPTTPRDHPTPASGSHAPRSPPDRGSPEPLPLILAPRGPHPHGTPLFTAPPQSMGVPVDSHLLRAPRGLPLSRRRLRQASGSLRPRLPAGGAAAPKPLSIRSSGGSSVGGGGRMAQGSGRRTLRGAGEIGRAHV